jgi:hypothetical protein
MRGIPEQYIAPLLKGDMVITVDVESQMFGLDLREDGDYEDYPKIDIKDWYVRKSQEILSHGVELKAAIERKINQIQIRGQVRMSFNYEQIIKFVSGDNDAVLDELMEIEEVDELALLIRVVKEYIEKSMQIQSIIDWMRKTYPNEFKYEKEIIPEWDLYQTILQSVTETFNELLNFEFVNKTYKGLDNYIEATKEIDNVLSKGIEPVDIMDNYSAGWLSPEGIYYGLNGEIANMLHIQIGDALLEAGIIPSDYNKIALNTSQWLEIAGWVKIHNCNVQFAGCLNKKEGVTNSIPNVNMTKLQAEIIFKYLHELHGNVCKLGWRMTPITAHMFLRLSDNPELMNEKYFEF